MLLFMDGQAHFTSAQIGLKYTNVNSELTTWSVAPEGRTGNCLKRTSLSGFSDGYVDVAPLMTRSGVWTPNSSGIVGCAVKLDLNQYGGPNNNGGADGLFCVMERGNHLAKITLNSPGTLSYVQPWGPFDNYGAAMATSAEGLTSNAWAYVEFKWKIHATEGLIEVKVNGVTVLSFTGDTSSHHPAWLSWGRWDAIRLLRLQSAGSLTVRMCDLYLADLASSASADVDDFLGDGTIVTIRPNAPGDAAGWTPVPAALANWDATNDLTPDGDASIVRTTAPGTRDVYHFEDIPTGATVLGAHYNALARKEEEGGAGLQPIVRQGSTDYDGPEQGVANITYDRYLTQPYDVNPATLAQWTPGEINAGQFGVLKSR